MNDLPLLLLAATLLCSLTTGLVFAFTVVVMPGIRTLSDRDFLGAFKAMDRIIQNNDPRFLLVWVGSVVTLIAATVVYAPALSGMPQALLFGAVALFFVGVQLPTFVFNVPLNNQLQALDLHTLDTAGLEAARAQFEARWIFWNAFRTACGVIATGILLTVLYAA
ncbi:MAG: DUF1772 domain-containing protein [Bacteroidota bacterium]